MSKFEDLFENQRDLEAHVLGAVIELGGVAFQDLQLEPKDFSVPSFAKIFEVLVELYDRHGSFSLQVLLQRFTLSRDPVVYGDLLYAYELGAICPKLLPSWLPILYELSAQRQIRELMLQTDGVDDAREVQERIASLLERVDRSVFRMPDLKLQMEETLDDIRKPKQRIATCYPELNDLIVGFAPGRFYVVGARPGVGKTLVGMELAWRVSKSVPVAFFSLEMTRQDILKRVFAMELDIELDKLEQNRLSERESALIDDLILNVSVDRQLFLDDPAKLTVANLRSFIVKAKQKVDLKVLFVDYLQLLDEGASRDQRDKVMKISIAMKQIAKEFGLSVVCLAQLNRGAKDDERPFASDLKESGQIEQDADVILLLSRRASEFDKYEAESSVTFANLGDEVVLRKSLMLLDVVKNRHGRVGSFVKTVLGQFSRLGPAA